MCSGKSRTSKLRVKPLVFEVINKGDYIVYSVQLSDAEREILEMCKGNVDPYGLLYASRTWSPEQGEKMSRNFPGMVC